MRSNRSFVLFGVLFVAFVAMVVPSGVSSAAEDCVTGVTADPSGDPEADLRAKLADGAAAATAGDCTDWRVELSGTFTLTESLVWSSGIPLHLVGPEGGTARIEAQGSDPGHRLLTVDTFPDIVEVTLERLVLAGGETEADDVPGDLHAGEGGAVLADDLVLIDVELIGNSADVGGAVSTLDLTATRTSFVGNRADLGDAEGGAIRATGRVELTNVTFRGNSAGAGGAVHLAWVAVLSTSLTATNVTFLDNTATTAGGGAHLHLVGDPTLPPVTLRGVLLGAVDEGSNGPACTASVDDSAALFVITATTASLAATDGCDVPVGEGIASLTYDDVAFLSGASDLPAPTGDWAGLDAYACPEVDGWPATDQRGVARPQGATALCDVGAVERVYVAPTPPVEEDEPDPVVESVSEPEPVLAGPVPTSIPAGGGGCADGCR